jgi:hypothetical protein
VLVLVVVAAEFEKAVVTGVVMPGTEVLVGVGKAEGKLRLEPKDGAEGVGTSSSSTNMGSSTRRFFCFCFFPFFLGVSSSSASNLTQLVGDGRPNTWVTGRGWKKDSLSSFRLGGWMGGEAEWRLKEINERASLHCFAICRSCESGTHKIVLSQTAECFSKKIVAQSDLAGRLEK